MRFVFFCISVAEYIICCIACVVVNYVNNITNVVSLTRRGSYDALLGHCSMRSNDIFGD